MKKTILFLLITYLVSSSLIAQETIVNETIKNFNELKLNGLFLVVGALEITYEATLNKESGVGVSVFLPIDNDVRDDINYYISPYYRLYFGEKYAAGFFVEGFGMLNSTNNYNYYIGSNTSDKNSTTDFALGIGLGGKWITNSGFIGELSLGIGRNLFNNSENDFEIISKGGMTIGYRF